MNKVEQVARALAVADGMSPEAVSNDEDQVPVWTLYVPDAIAALKAMREPTEAMEAAGRDANPRGPTVWPDYDAKDVFTAMIDAALSEAGETNEQQ